METMHTDTTQVIKKGSGGVLDVLGPAIEFLTSPENTDLPYCVMIGTIPPGVSVPLHSHNDVESFYVLSGVVQVLSHRREAFEWLEVQTGDFVHVPGGAKHAFRNGSSAPVVQLITTTPRIGRFFKEIGKPAMPGKTHGPPAAEELRHFVEVSARYGYWLGSPEENAAIGISLG
jgi:quercetin dioxygenase-like cupin family protein